MARVARRARARSRTPMPGSTGMAGTPTGGAAGRPPTTSSGWRRDAGSTLWAHDHHALLASHAALRTGGVSAETPDPAGGVIRRGRRRVARGRPVRDRGPPRLDPRAGVRARPTSRPTSRPSGGSWSRSGWSPATIRRALPRTRTSPSRSRPTRTSRRPGRLPVRLHASVRERRRSTRAIARGIRSGAVLGARSRRAAPGSAGRSASPTGRWVRGPRPCSRTSSPSPISRCRRTAAAASGSPPPEELAALAARAAAAGIATQIHAIGDAAVRAALDVLDPDGRRCPADAAPRARPARPPADRARFASGRHRGQRPAGPPRVGRDRGPAAVGRPRGVERLPVGVARRGPAPSSRSGRMRRSSRSTRGPASRWRSVARIRAGRPARRRSGPARRSRSTGRCGPPASTRRCRRARRTAAGSSPGHRADRGRARRPRSSTSRSSRAGRSRRRARASC